MPIRAATQPQRRRRAQVDRGDPQISGGTAEPELVPQDGYPFPLHLRVPYLLGPNGLETRLTATNPGSVAVPYGCCPHPYLVAGPGPLDGWILTVPAARRVEKMSVG